MTFPGLEHRMEEVGRIGKVRFINDSKATNADAARQAMSSYPRFWWIAGGRPKAGGIDELKSLFPRVERAYLVGEAAPDFAVHHRRRRAVDHQRRPGDRGRPGLDRRGGLRRGGGGAALAGLRLLRPVPRLRGARRGVPLGGDVARRQEGGRGGEAFPRADQGQGRPPSGPDRLDTSL